MSAERRRVETMQLLDGHTDRREEGRMKPSETGQRDAGGAHQHGIWTSNLPIDCRFTRRGTDRSEAHSAYYHDTNEFIAEQRAELQKARTSLRMTNGFVCLSIGSVLFLAASILAFIAGAGRTPQIVSRRSIDAGSVEAWVKSAVSVAFQSFLHRHRVGGGKHVARWRFITRPSRSSRG